MQAMDTEFVQAGAWVGPASVTARSVFHGVSTPLEPTVASLLDELDYGVILLRDIVRVVHLNQAALAEVRAARSVEVVDGALRACRGRDAQALAEGLNAAAQRGLRRLVTLGAEGARVSVALIPLGTPEPGPTGLTVAVFGRRHLCERISVQWFARAHGLTPAESHVLELLCEGLDPRDIASINGVGMATVRTQVNKIREKTGAPSIRGLIQQVAMLPPMVSSLRC